MLTIHGVRDGRFIEQQVDVDQAEAGPPPGIVWFDLYQPTAAEQDLVEGWLEMDIPTRAEREEIEASSRLYSEGGTSFLTGTIVRGAKHARGESATVTFALTHHHLVTVRHADLAAFSALRRYARRQPRTCGSAPATFAALLDTLVERIADVLEAGRGELDDLSREIFAERTGTSDRDYRDMLGRIGTLGNFVSKARESLLSLARLVAFARQLEVFEDTRVAGRLVTIAQDINSLTDHAAFLNNKITFSLDATLGMISIQQNAIIKIFSVVAVVFLPPTLIASIYGMNFEVMPELQWVYGYPAALLAMLVSAVLPYLFFKYRGWL